MKLSPDITLTDLFCGAGGSSSGARSAGVRVRMAANHWRLAVESHNANHPEADHDCADISATDPRRYPSTTILWASPECTNHSQAKGIPRKRKAEQLALGEDVKPLPDEAAERSRATMWDVPRFAERHRYRYVLVENVVDARHWVMFDAWLAAMHALGYEHQAVFLNSMHAASGADDPAPQSRDRMYVVFWLKGEKAPDLRITPDAWCGRCDRQVEAFQSWKKPMQPWGKYRSQYLYRCPSCREVVEPYVLPAAVAIDWTLPGELIGARTKPLAEKTRARIAAGLRRYARPIHLEAGGNQYDSLDPKHPQYGEPGAYVRAWPVDEHLRTLHTAVTKALAYPPLLVPVEGREGKVARTVGDPLRTQSTRNETGLAVPPLLVPAGGTWRDRAVVVDEPMPTRTTRETDGVLVPPFIAELRGGGSVAREVIHPLATLTASGLHHGLVEPPAMVMRNNGSRGDGGEMCTPVTEELRTLTTAGHQSLVQWAALYGYDSGDLRSLRRPLPTQTTVQGDALLTGDLPEVDECLFRMLEPHEIGRGMAFEHDYVVLGNKREQVRQYGNAVTPPAAALLLERVLAAMGQEVDACHAAASRA